ncbi:MAG: diaminopimelate decarboxylase [Dehalococcoidales bacterium]|nr:diaminopimelate decarboxylase [Dehalococcoidales bacterium]
MTKQIPRLALFPATTELNQKGHLTIGGFDTVALATEFGTPLYVFDETGLRNKCREFKQEFGKRYARTTVVYASKAFLNKAIAGILKEEGIWLDAVSAGEFSIARAAGFPMQQVYFHGNNKSAEELYLAIEWGIGHIVVDNFQEMAVLNELAGKLRVRPSILLRLTPNIDAHTHRFLSTGVTDSKFGFPLSYGGEAVSKALASPNVNLVGLHCHIGSSIFEVQPFLDAVDNMLKFAVEMKQKYSFELQQLDIGGGFALQYVVDNPAPPVAAYAEAITSRMAAKCKELKLNPPELLIEPGRSMVGQSGVALYTVGAIKEVPGVRTFACVDGGMGDNIRPAIYDAKYEAVAANKVSENDTQKVTIAGKYCESGDILIRDIDLPEITAGDIIAIPSCGAYCIPMASNYNASLKPAIVMVKDGQARLIRRRETYKDLVSTDFV